MRALLCVLLLGFGLISLAAAPAFADPWTLLVQPPPYSNNPPPYDRWQPLQQFGSREECLDARMTLHYQYWPTDEDLSRRALTGVCRDQSTGAIAADFDDDAEARESFTCYGSDRGAASQDHAVHYNWARSRDVSALKAGLDMKLKDLFGCPEKTGAGLAKDFADMSLVVARYVRNAACLRNDQGAISLDWSVHHNWAERRNRDAMLSGARWKMLAALDCLDRESALNYYADVSVVMARAGAR